MSPSRRTLLQACGVALSAAVGGCLSQSGGSPATDARSSEGTGTGDATEVTRTTTTTETTESNTPADATTSATAPPEVREVDGVDRGVPSALVGKRNGDPFRSFAVGSRENVANPDDGKPHGAWVWNETDEALTVELALTADGETVLDESYGFDAAATIAIELREPRQYELTVRANDREEVAEVDRDRFDCNDSATDVAVRDDEIETGWITTELTCSTATPSDNA